MIVFRTCNKNHSYCALNAPFVQLHSLCKKNLQLQDFFIIYVSFKYLQLLSIYFFDKNKLCEYLGAYKYLYLYFHHQLANFLELKSKKILQIYENFYAHVYKLIYLCM